MSYAARVLNQQVNGQANYKRAAPIFHCEEHKMHMLLVALDYRRTGRPLSCAADARNVEEVARQCGVHMLVPMYDEQCTKEAILDAIQSTGSKCGPDDYFIFCFHGHSTFVRSELGPGHDEAFVVVDGGGQVSNETLLLDEEFSDAVLAACPPETRVLIVMDLCHSGAVVDLTRERWSGRQALSIVGSRDVQGQDDSGRGGIFSHTLLLAIDKLSRVGRDNYSVGMLYNAALYENELVFKGRQDIAISASPNFSPDAMAWPLVPPVGYQAPLSRCTGPGGILSNAASFGINPAIMQHVTQEALNAPVSIEDYLSHVQGLPAYQLKPCRACAAGCAANQCSLQ